MESNENPFASDSVRMEEEEEEEEEAHRKSQKATDMRRGYDDHGINTFCPEPVPTNRARAMNLRLRPMTFYGVNGAKWHSLGIV